MSQVARVRLRGRPDVTPRVAHRTPWPVDNPCRSGHHYPIVSSTIYRASLRKPHRRLSAAREVA